MRDKDGLFLIVLYGSCVIFWSNGLKCFTCFDAVSNEQCNREGSIVECHHDQQSCQNEVRLSEGNRYRITKRCKQKLACENNQLQNDRPAWEPTQCNPEFTQNSVCRCCCDTDLCNEMEMPCDKNPRCSSLQRPANGEIDCTNLNFARSICSFRCNRGYKLIGSVETECEEHQRGLFWNKEAPICQRSACGNSMPPGPQNGQFRCSNSNQVSSVCRFACDEGYELQGPTEVECESNGVWSNSFPTCQEITCNEEELEIANGAVGCNNRNSFGSRCAFECIPGYLMEGIPTTTCGNYKWTNPAPSCVRGTCNPARPPPLNGSVSCSDGSKSFSSCTFFCGRTPRDDSWDLYGGDTATCDWNAASSAFQWSNLEVPCCAKRCPPHAIVDLFLVLDSSSSVGRDNWNKTLFFVKDVIEQFQVSEDDVLVAAIRYNRFVDTRSEIQIGQYTTKDSTVDAIINLPYDGSGTHTGNALEYVLENMVTRPGNRRNVKDFVFVVTDGISTDDVIGPARRLREYGATVLALGVVNKGGTLEKEDIAEIAGSPETAFLIESGFEGLSLNVADLIEKQLCGDNPCE